MSGRSGKRSPVGALLVAVLLGLLLPGKTSYAQTPLILEISQIQGMAHTSPYVGQFVETTGVITAKRSTSFWMQSQTADGNSATSEGLLVFGPSTAALSVGALVRVRGTVVEFRPGGSATANLTTTEIASPMVSVTQLSCCVAVAPTVIGAGGRVPPSQVIDNDATGNVETSGTFDHNDDGIDFYESLEGMLVQVNTAVAVGPRNPFGEIPVLADGGAGAGVRTARGGIVIRATDFNPERVILDDTLMATPVVKVGDGFTTPVLGILDYSFGNFKLNVTTALAPVAGTLAREVTASQTDHEIAVATYNVENLSPASGAAAFTEHAQIIVNNLRSPDLLAIEEIQDNSGPADDGVTDASVTWNMLIQAIQAVGGPLYQFRQINPLNNADGGVPGGNIRAGFLFRTDRGLTFIDRPGGDATKPVMVVSPPSGPQLSFSPGLVDPQNSAWSTPEGVRKPLAGEFIGRGKKLFVIANHWKSKTQDHPLFGRFQPPVRVTEVQRNAEAQVVRAFVDQILAADPQANVIVLGDLNDFEFSLPLMTLKGGGSLALTALIETLPQNERYTYVFEGNSQTLDHILLSQNLAAHFSYVYDVVHVNSEYPDQASDHEPQVVRLDLRGRPTPKP